MIFNMSGGGGGAGLNFKIVGNPQPAEAKENTIWIDTNEDITGWHFDTIEPENPTPGMVWIYYGTTNAAKLNLLKKNGISVNPSAARQYINDAWVGKPAAIWKNGEWISEWGPYLCNHGDECVDFTGGWETTIWAVTSDAGGSASTTTCQKTQYPGYLRFDKTGTYGAVIHTVRAIDLTNVKAIHFKGEMAPTTTGRWVAFHVWTKIGGSNAYWATNSKATVQSEREGKQGFVLDVSALSGSYYLGFGIYNADHYVEIEDLYLEVEE